MILLLTLGTKKTFYFRFSTMCTYHGILEEYPLISIDSFETYNYTSTMFFITHIHMDHLVGLERPEFGKYVAKINASIYMSEISKQLLSTMAPYRHLIPYFKSVPIDQPFSLTIQSNDPVQAKKKEGASKLQKKIRKLIHFYFR
jgi:ribonuclease BN (tRNA processing enzyme)